MFVKIGNFRQKRNFGKITLAKVLSKIGILDKKRCLFKNTFKLYVKIGNLKLKKLNFFKHHI